MRKNLLVGVLVLLIGLMIVACGGAAAPTPAAPATEQAAATEAAATEETATEAAATEAAASGEATDFITWYAYDQNNEDTASDERVGNEYLRNTIPLFNEAFKGKWNWVNQPKVFDKMTTELIAAVQADGEVPDLTTVSSMDVFAFHQNGTLQDLTAWAKAQPWFSALDANALEACQGPDGALYCIPVSQQPQLVFVWKDRFPDGYPKTPEAFLKRAEELKADGLYALTFFGSTDYDGLGLERFIWTTLSSFGGKLDDGQGKMKLNSPENIAAIEFIRTLVSQGYAPEIAFAGQFQEEEAFKDASAGSFPTGMFGYRYVNPLTAPSGKTYQKKNEEDMLDAIAAGDVYLSPFLSVEGVKPGCNINVLGFGIPADAQHPEAAHDYINWIMETKQNAAWVLAPGGGFPVLKTTQEDELFQTPFYQESAKAVANSNCTPWYGSLERRDEAKKLIMTTIYKLIKEDPSADIAKTLQATDDEYNSGN